MPGYDKSSPPTESYLVSPDKSFIQVDEVSKSFELVEAVSKVSFKLEKGIIFGIIGSDGAGKSTLLRMMATMIRPSSGNIKIDGMDVVKHKTKIKHLIGYMPQRFGLYQDLTVGENIDFFMDIFGIYGDERTKRRERYLGFSNLLPFINRKAGDLSGGMKQKLGLACVLVHQPRVLILDEPTNGVDPVSRQEFWDILSEMRSQDMTILISTAYLDEGEKCDYIAIMHRSRILDMESPKTMRSNFSSLEEAMIHRIKEVDKGLIIDQFRF